MPNAEAGRTRFTQAFAGGGAIICTLMEERILEWGMAVKAPERKGHEGKRAKDAKAMNGA